MGARETDWIMVRLRREVHARVRELGERWEREAERIPTQVPTQGDSRWTQVSVSDLVAELLRRVDAHARRRKHSREKKAAERRAARAGQVPPGATEPPPLA